jgi:hypothetical protein
MSAILNHKQKPPISWKGQSFSQISSTIQKNVRPDTLSLFKPKPICHYRRELKPPSEDSSVRCNARTSVKFDLLNIPNGNTVKETDSGVVPMNSIEINRIQSSCLNTINNSCFSAESNAVARVRSSGMFRKEVDSNQNRLSDAYSASYTQYLKNRNKNFEQNLNTKTNIGGECTSTHKVNNAKYGTQGAVSASSRLERLKLDTVNKAAHTMKDVYGQETSNAMKYRGASAPAYTVKDKIGTLMPKTPVYYAGVMRDCVV